MNTTEQCYPVRRGDEAVEVSVTFDLDDLKRLHNLLLSQAERTRERFDYTSPLIAPLLERVKGSLEDLQLPVSDEQDDEVYEDCEML